MEIRRYKNILGLRDAGGKWLGFHAHNLSIAELSDVAWSETSELDQWSAEQDPETNWAKDKTWINTLSVNVAQICNLACTYCAAGGDGTYGSAQKRLDAARFNQQLKIFLHQLPDEETEFNIHFLGGEPLLFPGILLEIADFAKSNTDKKIRFSITTNGTLINSRTAKILADLKAGITISLDGEKEVNDRVRPNKGSASSTDMTLAGLKQLKPYRDQLDFLSVNCVFGQHNMAVLEAYSFLSELNLDWDVYNFNFSNLDKDLAVVNAYINQMTELAKLAFEKGGISELSKIAQFRSTMSRIESKTRLNSYCGAGKSLLQVDTSHKIYPCNWFMSDESEMLGQDLELNVTALKKYQAPLYELNSCESCWARHLCAGGCMAVHKASSGDKHQKDPQFCLRSRSLSALAIFYYYKALNQGEQNEEH